MAFEQKPECWEGWPWVQLREEASWAEGRLAQGSQGKGRRSLWLSPRKRGKRGGNEDAVIGRGQVTLELWDSDFILGATASP